MSLIRKVTSDMSQYWTAVIASDGSYECKNHFGSFSPHTAKSELEKDLPKGAAVVALIPGKQAQNSVLFNSKASLESDVRFINPYDSIEV